MFKYPFPSQFRILLQIILMSKTGSIFSSINFSLVFMGEMPAGQSCMYCRACFTLFFRALSTDCCSSLPRNSLFCYLFICLQRHSVTSVPLSCPIKMVPCMHSLKTHKCKTGDNSFSVVKLGKIILKVTL